MMVEDIVALLYFFEDKVQDIESNNLVRDIAEDKNKWVNAHGVFSKIRERNLKAIEEKDKVKECQYCFEEVCAQSLFNLTNTDAPFDPDSPYWVIKNALSLANALNIPTERIVEIVT